MLLWGFYSVFRGVSRDDNVAFPSVFWGVARGGTVGFLRVLLCGGFKGCSVLLLNVFLIVLAKVKKAHSNQHFCYSCSCLVSVF